MNEELKNLIELDCTEAMKSNIIILGQKKCLEIINSLQQKEYANKLRQIYFKALKENEYEI